MDSRKLRRTRRQVALTLDDVIDKVDETARALGKEVEKAGGELGAEIAALPDQLEGLRRGVVEKVEPYRPPKQYRPYVQVGFLVLVVAAVVAIVLRRRMSADDGMATVPDRFGYQPGSGEDGLPGPISAAPAASSESEGQQG
ncbi:MAG TPA: hypothetical protein VGE11_27125 [Pseudonocardia sp.]